MTASKKTSDLLSAARILVADDDNLFRSVLLEQLKLEGVKKIKEAVTVSDLINQINIFIPDLVILDVQLPGGDGLETCAQLRQSGFDKPILMFTNQDDENHIVESLKAGANDCISKPVRISELLGRLKAQLRQFRASDDVRLPIGYIDFLPANKSLHDKQSSKTVTLTEKEALILKTLFRTWPDDVTKESLLMEVWGFQPDISTHTLETHIYRLRQKLSSISANPIIQTTERGYLLNK